MSTLQIALTSELEQLIDSQLESGGYRSPGEVVREALKLLAERNARRGAPDPQVVRVAGRLEAGRAQDGSFELVLESGRKLRGMAPGVSAEKLRGLRSERIVVSGLASFAPGGHVEHIEADHLEKASGDLTLWEAEPQPIDRSHDPSHFRVPQDGSTGLGAVFGRWPGQESDEEVFQALDELS